MVGVRCCLAVQRTNREECEEDTVDDYKYVLYVNGSFDPGMIEKRYPISDARYVDYGSMVRRGQKLSEMKRSSKVQTTASIQPSYRILHMACTPLDGLAGLTGTALLALFTSSNLKISPSILAIPVGAAVEGLTVDALHRECFRLIHAPSSLANVTCFVIICSALGSRPTPCSLTVFGSLPAVERDPGPLRNAP